MEKDALFYFKSPDSYAKIKARSVAQEEVLWKIQCGRLPCFSFCVR